MSEKFKPDPEILPPLSQLMAIATVKDDDVLGAIEEWETKPPDKKFDGILRADEATEDE
ncbi:MAG: hypothetical protein HC781_18125 [Leptolyngbyaceae cyanobacterium CSU_1_4]|nr:hypothetical protein [Leptolyngbyaceae cyanobacterium CSU_1_4]